jgi:hypothetical protein
MQSTKQTVPEKRNGSEASKQAQTSQEDNV